MAHIAKCNELLSRRKFLIASGILFGCGLALWCSGEIPYVRRGGSAIVPHPPLPQILAGTFKLSPGDRIVFEGDSNTAGTRLESGAQAYPERFGSYAGGRYIIENRAKGGATLDGWKATAATAASLAILMFGSNDAAARGWLSHQAATPIAVFERKMRKLIALRNAANVAVLVLAAPPAGSEAMDRRIAPFRSAARRAAMHEGALFLDPMEALQEESAAMLQFDALHLNAEAQDMLGRWLARALAPGAHS